MSETNEEFQKLQEMIDNLKSGDKVITTGGIFGTVVAVRGDRLQLRIAENVKVDVARNAIASTSPLTRSPSICRCRPSAATCARTSPRAASG